MHAPSSLSSSSSATRIRLVQRYLMPPACRFWHHRHQIVPFEFFVEKWIYQVDKFESTWDSRNLVSTAITYVRLPVLVALYFPAARPVAVARFSGCFLPVYFSGTLHRTENYSFLRDSTEKYTFQHRLEQFVCSCVFCEIRLFLLWAAIL